MKEDIVIFDKKTGIAEIKSGTEVIPQNTILGSQKVKVLIIPEGVKEIRPFAFANLRNLKKVVLPSTLEIIGTFGFGICGDAETELPDSIRQLGRGALDFAGGKITLNSSNSQLVEEVGYSFRDHTCCIKSVDETLTISNIKYNDPCPEMTTQQAWKILWAHKRQAERAAARANDLGEVQ